MFLQKGDAAETGARGCRHRHIYHASWPPNRFRVGPAPARSRHPAIYLLLRPLLLRDHFWRGLRAAGRAARRPASRPCLPGGDLTGSARPRAGGEGHKTPGGGLQVGQTLRAQPRLANG
eukprot:scaffold1929_cov376-Prasinococcus_capsulatus_cf.AAC.31